MLAVAPPRGAERGDSMENFASLGGGGDNFSDTFSGGDFLEDIDFDDIFVGFDEADEMPDLEVDPNEIFRDLSVYGSSQEQSVTTSSMEGKSGDPEAPEEMTVANRDTEDDGTMMATENSSAGAGEGDTGGKGAGSHTKGSQGKKKAKVDWTPELHRRFVQAVEHLGVEKAVPSKILEIMGIDGLTRHNIASHLQKYRSHRKHLLAREAEAATWSQRRRLYGGAGGGTTAGAAAVTAVVKRGVTAPWMAPTMGFPPPPMHHYRPLHVWGHPTADHAMMHMWPRPGLVPSRPPLPPWGPPPPADPSTFWHPHPHYPRGVPPCLPPQPLPLPTRVTGKPVAGIPPQQPIYKHESPIPVPAKHLQMELLPSNECIDAALGDVLSNPYLPLPLGLKPPSVDSVMNELQKQGISKIPPSCA